MPVWHQVVEQEWGVDLISSWNKHGWFTMAGRVGAKIARLIGAKAHEVMVADSTSVNLFKVVSAALQLRPQRRIIVSGVLSDIVSSCQDTSHVVSMLLHHVSISIGLWALTLLGFADYGVIPCDV